MNIKSTSKYIFRLLLVLTLLFVLVIAYEIYVIKQKNEKASELAVALGSDIRESSAYSGLKKIIKETEADRQELNRYILSKNNAVGFIENLESIGETTGVKVLTQSVNVIDKKGTQMLEVHFSGQGTWAQVVKFMILVEHMPYEIITNQARMSLESETKVKVKKIWKGDFVITTKVI